MKSSFKSKLQNKLQEQCSLGTSNCSFQNIPDPCHFQHNYQLTYRFPNHKEASQARPQLLVSGNGTVLTLFSTCTHRPGRKFPFELVTCSMYRPEYTPLQGHACNCDCGNWEPMRMSLNCQLIDLILDRTVQHRVTTRHVIGSHILFTKHGDLHLVNMYWWISLFQFVPILMEDINISIFDC